jgi:hypothetical protein
MLSSELSDRVPAMNGDSICGHDDGLRTSAGFSEYASIVFHAARM